MLRGVLKVVNEFSRMSAVGMASRVPVSPFRAAICGMCP